MIALKPLFRNVYQDNAFAIDQLLSGQVKYVFPKYHSEIYFEYGWNDGTSNSRDLILDMSHSAASIFGIRKIEYLSEKTYINFEVEATQMAQRPSYLQRNSGNWYIHTQLPDGYTNENQILGAGSGLGNNVQTFAISLNKGWNKIGIKFQHIARNPMQLATYWPTQEWQNIYLNNIAWHDLAYGIVFKKKVKNILFNLNMEFVNSKNYLWQNNNKASNIYVFFNTIYLW